MDRDAFNYISLCAGGGGLDIGVDLAVRNARCVCRVEHEAYACEILASRVEEEALDEAPLWTDLRTFDGRPWRGIVDCVVAGYPCQPFSVAGRRRGEEDPRHLWPQIARILGECRPGYVFLENVAGHLRLGFDSVLVDLAALGFDAVWGCVRASEVGASHRRERLFVLAARAMEDGNDGQRFESDEEVQAGWITSGDAGGAVAHAGGQCGQVRPESDEQRRQTEAAEYGSPLGDALRLEREPGPGRRGVRQDGAAGADAKDADGRRELQSGNKGRGRAGPARGDAGVADAEQPGPQRARPEDTARRSESAAFREDGGALPLFPPGPGDVEAWREILDRWPEVEPAVRGMADGLAPRVDRLRLCGNGVVPIQAAYAFCALWDVLLD